MRILNCPLFAGMSFSEVQNLLGSLSARQKDYGTGESIGIRNYKKEIIGIVLEGKIVIKRTDIEGNEILLETVRAGGLFGEMFSYAKNDYNETIIFTTTKSRILYLNYNDIMQSCTVACSYRHKLVTNLFEIVCRKTVELSERINVISCKTIREKLMHYFSGENIKNSGKPFKLEMSLSNLAEFICIDRSAMMREIKRMKEDNKIIIENKVVTLISK